jgi:hypothetical protein
VYYYTYGSVLAALSRPASNKCDLAMKVLNDVKVEVESKPETYADARQTILFDIVQPSEFICQSLNEGGTPATSVPGADTTETPATILPYTPTPLPN